MNRRMILLLAGLILASISAADSFACGQACGGCDAPQTVQVQRGRIGALVGDAVHLGMRGSAAALKAGARVAGDAPREARKQVAAHSPRVQSSVQMAARRAEHTMQQLTAEVTSLSLHLLRSVFSYFWALVSGLLLS